MTAEVQANRITKLESSAGVGGEQYGVYRMCGAPDTVQCWT